MSLNKKKWILILICVNLIYSTQKFSVNTLAELDSKTFLEPSSTIIQSIEYYDEDVVIEVNSTGEIRSQYYWENSDKDFFQINFDQLETQYPTYYTKLEFIEMNFYNDVLHPEKESSIKIIFNAKSQVDAISYGDWFFKTLMCPIIQTFEFSECEVIDSLEGDEVQYQSEYLVNFDWQIIRLEFNSSISSNFMGIAGSINITEADELRFSVEKINNLYTKRWGAIWNTEVEKIAGDYTLSIIDQIHSKSISKSPNTPLSIQFTYILPKIESDFTYSAFDPSQMEVLDFSSQREPWNMEHHYEIKLTLRDNEIYPDFKVNFTASFVPVNLQRYEKANLFINHYGYEGKELEIQHENATLWYPHFQSLSAPLIKFEGKYSYQSKQDEYNIQLELVYNNQTPILQELEFKSAELKNNYDLTYNSEDTVCENGVYWENATNPIIVSRFFLSFNHTLIHEQWMGLFDPEPWIFSHSHIAESDIATSTSIEEKVTYCANVGGYYTKVLKIKWDPLYELIQAPEKTYEEEIWKNFAIDFAPHFGWESIEKNANFDKLQLFLQAPIIEGSVITPMFNLSAPLFGFNYQNQQIFHQNLEFTLNHITIYSETPYLFENHEINSFSQFVLQYYHKFFADTIDMTTPLGYFGYIINGEEHFVSADEFQINNEFSNNTQFLIETKDENYTSGWGDTNYWDGEKYSNRFFSSGNTNQDFIFSLTYLDINLKSQKIEVDSSLTYNISQNYWNTFFDTTQLGNGFYLFSIVIFDLEDNTHRVSWKIKIQNEYPDDLITPSIEFVAPTPQYGTKVNTTVEIVAQISDPQNIFASSISFGEYPFIPAGFLMNPLNMDNKFMYQWNTLEETENALIYITLKAISFNGQWAEQEYYLKIDNLYPGALPNISIVYPKLDNSTLLQFENLQKFEVFVWDDHFPLESVLLQIDDSFPKPMNLNTSKIWSNIENLDNTTQEHMLLMNKTYDMTLNRYGYFEINYNISQLINGSHTLTFLATDRDDPDEGTGQHTEKLEYHFYALTSNYPVTFPPLFRNVFPGNYTNSSEYLQDKIEFTIEISDDIGIQRVFAEISILNYTNSSSYPNFPNSALLEETKQLVRTEELEQQGIDQEWMEYSFTLNSLRVDDGMYLINITIIDSDYFQHSTSVVSFIIINNSDVSLLDRISGYKFLLPISLLGLSGLILKKKKLRWPRN